MEVPEKDNLQEIKEKIFNLKQEIFKKKKNIKEIEKLINQKIEKNYKVNLWELTENELDKEMGTRLSILNEDIDCLPQKTIKSHRKFIGFFIVLLKKIIRFITLPYLKFIFERQKIFNEEIVAYQLAEFIRFRQLEEKINKLSQDLIELKDQVEILVENSKVKKDGKK